MAVFRRSDLRPKVVGKEWLVPGPLEGIFLSNPQISRTFLYEDVELPLIMGASEEVLATEKIVVVDSVTQGLSAVVRPLGGLGLWTGDGELKLPVEIERGSDNKPWLQTLRAAGTVGKARAAMLVCAALESGQAMYWQSSKVWLRFDSLGHLQKLYAKTTMLPTQ